MASFLAELRRRNVAKVAVAYAIVGWLLIEVASTVFPILQIPEWAVALVTMLLLLGFPVAIVLSWAYEVTPEGIKKTRHVPLEESITHITGQMLNYVITGLLVLVLGFVVIDQYVLEGGAPEARLQESDQPAGSSPAVAGEAEGVQRDQRSIAVLPFENRSAREEDQFFVDGIHDDILTQLAKISDLKVISRTSVMEYREGARNLRAIGQELGVAAILEGAVQRAGNTVRINVQLIDAETDAHVEAWTYDRALTAENIFAIQTEMATSIAEALQATLSPQEVARLNEIPTHSRRAWEFYISGNDYRRRDDEGTFMPLAVEQYKRAIDEDSRFALAWAGLSRAHGQLYFFRVDRSESRRNLAEEAVQRAFDLAPDSPEVHIALGQFYINVLRDHDSALREYEIAEEGMPGNAEIYLQKAFAYRQLGELPQALANFDRTIDLDPKNAEALANLGSTYLMLRDYNLAEQYLDRALEIAPDNLFAYLGKANIAIYRDGAAAATRTLLERAPMDLQFWGRWDGWRAALYERDYETALSYVEDINVEVIDVRGSYLPTGSLYGVAYQLAGQSELAEPHFREARVQVEEALAGDPEDPRLYVARGEVLIGLGERDSALDMARRAIELMPTVGDAFAESVTHCDVIVRVLAPAGDTDTAIEELDAYLSSIGWWSIEGLLLDPRLDAIRNDPRFEALVEKYRRQ